MCCLVPFTQAPAETPVEPTKNAQVSRERLEAAEKRDVEKRAAAAAKNDLEAYIIAMRGALEGGETLAQARSLPSRSDAV